MSIKQYCELEESTKDDLKNSTKEECVFLLHDALGNLHLGLISKHWESCWFWYERAQFILENYYIKRSYSLCDQISGEGYGYDHNWIEVAFVPCSNRKPPYTRHSVWDCTNCSARFRHFYKQEPDIFKAMKDYGIQDKCIRDIKPIR